MVTLPEAEVEHSRAEGRWWVKGGGGPGRGGRGEKQAAGQEDKGWGSGPFPSATAVGGTN